ncbi:MAG: GNAT family N-acetyltransferase [Gemmatimonadaceae bacterium]
MGDADPRVDAPRHQPPPGDAGPGPALAPVTLRGRWVRLEPLGMADVTRLLPVASDPELWRLTREDASTPDGLAAYVERALASQAQGTALPFVIVEQATGATVGSTRFGNYEPGDRRIEIGWTWVGRAWQRSAVNTEAKLLLLTHAFETLGLRRVELKTDVLNERSRRAILRLGATQEGIFREHMVTMAGRVRDSVWFSILAREWDVVKARLTAMLAAHETGGAA